PRPRTRGSDHKLGLGRREGTSWGPIIPRGMCMSRNGWRKEMVVTAVSWAAPGTVAVVRGSAAEAGVHDPAPRDGAVAEHPVVELFERPAFAVDEVGVEAFDLEAAEEVAHGDGRGGRVPIYVALGAGAGEADAVHEELAG